MDFVNCKTITELEKIPALRKAKEKVIAYWRDDVPSMRLFSRMGEAVAKNFKTFSDEEKQHIFAVVERGMRSKNTELVFFVACGTLGGMMWVAGNDGHLVRQIFRHCGKRSKSYCLLLRS